VAETPIGPGTVLAGRFTLDDLLDDTDGARFWRATDETLARSVAVHVIAESDARAEALLTAARTSALVTDGHLLRVLDAAAEDGVVYVVNEWGSGVSLDEMLSEGPLPPRRAAWVVKEVAEAIATAHRNGVAHGRLLPEKVMLTEAGSVKLVGFVVDAVLQDRAGRDQRRVTGGAVLSAHESDVINLAALLYAALVGRWPGTEGSRVPDAPAEHGRPLRPRQVRAGVPRPLDAICERVLNAGPHTHAVPIETAHEIYAALSDYIGDPAGAPQYEHTSVLDLAAAGELDDGPATELHTATPWTDPSSPGGPGGPDGTDTGDLAATGAFPAPMGSDDDDRTQAGVPVFHDQTTGVGWVSAGDLRSTPDHASDHASGPARGHAPGHTGDGQPSRGFGGFSGWSDEPTRRTSAPQAPPPDLPERPLFADGPTRAGTGTGHDAPAALTGTGWSGGADTGTASRITGTGRVPPVWGPDVDETEPGDPETGSWDAAKPGTSWLRLAAALAAVLVLVVGVVLAFNLGRGSNGTGTAAEGAGSPSGSPSHKASTPVAISAVTDFDPQGDPPEENSALAPLAADGKQSTAWRTSTYYDELAKLKDGVGLLVDLGKPTEVGKVRVDLLGNGTSLDVLAGPDAQTAPTSTDGLDKVASVADAGSRANLALKKPVKTRWLVVWLTSLPSTPGGFQGRVAEISVSS
jgi:hypothetical protein